MKVTNARVVQSLNLRRIHCYYWIQFDHVKIQMKIKAVVFPAWLFSDFCYAVFYLQSDFPTLIVENYPFTLFFFFWVIVTIKFYDETKFVSLDLFSKVPGPKTILRAQCSSSEFQSSLKLIGKF